MQQKLGLAAQKEAEKRFPIFDVHLTADILATARRNQGRFVEGAKWGAAWQSRQKEVERLTVVVGILIVVIAAMTTYIFKHPC